MKQGFTLIELLVVVLIIGILSAIALPQYEKSVERARTAEALLTTKSIVDAASIYSTTYRTCPNTLSDLDVKVDGSSKDWSFGVTSEGARNCGATVSPTAGTAFTASRILVKNAATAPANMSTGDMYWHCVSGTCTDFFDMIRVTPVSASSTYYK